MFQSSVLIHDFIALAITNSSLGQTVLEKAAVLGKIELIPSLLAYEVEGVKIDVNEADPQVSLEGY